MVRDILVLFGAALYRQHYNCHTAFSVLLYQFRCGCHSKRGVLRLHTRTAAAFGAFSAAAPLPTFPTLYYPLCQLTPGRPLPGVAWRAFSGFDRYRYGRGALGTSCTTRRYHALIFCLLARGRSSSLPTLFWHFLDAFCRPLTAFC